MIDLRKGHSSERGKRAWLTGCVLSLCAASAAGQFHVQVEGVGTTQIPVAIRLMESLNNKTLARLERDRGRLIEVLQVGDKGGRIPLGQP